MKLSEIKTADALILTLAAQGYTKSFQEQDIADQLKGQAAGLYTYGEHECPHCSHKMRQVDVWPCEITDRGDAGFTAVLNPEGVVIDWFAFEIYAGTTTTLDPDSELSDVTAAIDSWLAEVQ